MAKKKGPKRVTEKQKARWKNRTRAVATLKGIEQTKAQRSKIAKAKALINEMKQAGYTPAIVNQTEFRLSRASRPTRDENDKEIRVATGWKDRERALNALYNDAFVKDYLKAKEIGKLKEFSETFLPTAAYWELIDLLEKYGYGYHGNGSFDKEDVANNLSAAIHLTGTTNLEALAGTLYRLIRGDGEIDETKGTGMMKL